MAVSVVFYTPELDAAHLAFASQYWKKRGRLDKDYILWKYRDIESPARTLLAMAMEDGKVIGQLGLVSAIYSDANGNRGPAYWFCDLMVDIPYRGKGVATQLYQFILEQVDGIFLGSNPSPSALRSMKKFGFQEVFGGLKYILPVDIVHTLAMKLPALKGFGRFPNLPLLWYTALNKRSDVELDYDLQKFSFAKDEEISKSRDLNWRFIQRPLYNTNAFVLKLKNSGSKILVYETGDDYIVGHVNVEGKSQFATIISKLFSLALKNKKRSIRFNYTGNYVGVVLNALSIKMNEKTKILWLDKNNQLSMPKKFHYDYLDSDENI